MVLPVVARRFMQDLAVQFGGASVPQPGGGGGGSGGSGGGQAPAAVWGAPTPGQDHAYAALLGGDGGRAASGRVPPKLAGSAAGDVAHADMYDDTDGDEVAALPPVDMGVMLDLLDDRPPSTQGAQLRRALLRDGIPPNMLLTFPRASCYKGDRFKCVPRPALCWHWHAIGRSTADLHMLAQRPR